MGESIVSLKEDNGQQAPLCEPPSSGPVLAKKQTITQRATIGCEEIRGIPKKKSNGKQKMKSK